MKKKHSTVTAVLRSIRKTMKRFFSLLNVRKFPAPKKIHFFINLGVGIFIAALGHSLQHTAWGESIINSLSDIYIESEAAKAVANPLSMDKGNLVYVEIDHDAYVKWGEPPVTPRDKLAHIIKKCYDCGAKVLLLDILLENKDHSPGSSGDKEFRGALGYILEKEKHRRTGENNIEENSFAGIIFCRRVGFRGDLKKNIFHEPFGNSGQGNKPVIFYHGAPLFSANAKDNVVRYWNSYSKYLNENEEEDLIWGAPLVAVMLYENTAVRLDSLKRKILSYKGSGPDHKIDTVLFEGGNQYSLFVNSAHTYSQRIRFKLVPGEERIEKPEKKDAGRTGNEWAVRVKYNEHFDKIGAAFFQDKIVIIGNSSPDTASIHRTPVGDMPGMYLLGNAVNTILNTKQVKEPHWLPVILIELCVIGAAAYLFLYLNSLLAFLAAVILASLGLIELGYRYFTETGVFLNSGLIFWGMGFHKIAADIEKLFKERVFFKGGIKKSSIDEGGI